MRKKTKQLGQILIEQGLITDEQLREALKVQERVPKSLGRILIDLQLIKETDLVRALAHQIGLEFVDLSEHDRERVRSHLLEYLRSHLGPRRFHRQRLDGAEGEEP